MEIPTETLEQMSQMAQQQREDLLLLQDHVNRLREVCQKFTFAWAQGDLGRLEIANSEAIETLLETEP